MHMWRYFFYNPWVRWEPVPTKAGYWLRASAARICSCAATRLFVYRVRVQHRSAAAACGCWWTLSLRHKTVSTERTQHTEIPLPREKTAPILLDTRQVRVRQCSFCRPRQYGIDFARQSNEHCLARQPSNRYPARGTASINSHTRLPRFDAGHEHGKQTNELPRTNSCAQQPRAIDT
jgi:hypothetical protein